MNAMLRFTLLAIGCIFVSQALFYRGPSGTAVYFGYVFNGLSVLTLFWAWASMCVRDGVGKRLYLDHLGWKQYAVSHLNRLANFRKTGPSERRNVPEISDGQTWFDSIGQKSRLPGERLYPDQGPL